MRDGQRVAFNASLMVLKQALMAALGVVFVGFMARRLGVASWGEFQASLAIAGVASLLAGIGVRGYLAREVATRPELGPRLLGAALVIRGATGAVVLVVTLAGALLVGAGVGVTLVALAIVSQLAALLYTTLWITFEAHERFQYLVYAELGARLFVIALASTLILLDFGVVAVAAAFMLGNLLELAISYYLVRTRFYRAELSTPLSELISIARRSIPMGIVGALGSALMQTDRVLLRAVCGEESVGIYSAAWVLSDNFRMIGDVFLGVTFATGMRLYARDPGAFGRLFAGCMVVAAALGMPMAAGVLVLAPDIIQLVYGAGGGYDPSAQVLRILACQVPLAFAFQVGTLPLFAARQDGVLARLLAMALVANIALDLALLPRYGAVGAAFATVVVSVSSFVALQVKTARWVRQVEVVRIAGVAAATVLMACAAYGVRIVANMWAAIAVAVPVYIVLLLALRAVSWGDIRALLARRAPGAAAPAAPAA